MKTNTRVWFAAIVTLTASLGIVEARRAVVTSASQAVTTVPDIFKQFYEGPIGSDRVAAVRAALPFEQVSLERRGGIVLPCGCFKLTVAKNGEATLWSDEAKTFGDSGDFVGNVNIFDFGKLCHLISQAGVEKLNRRYEIGWTDAQTVTVSVTKGRETISIADYGGAGPVQVWSIEQAMMAIGHDIAWKRK
jgi:hypothetical protein